jgi:hypothetical protein
MPGNLLSCLAAVKAAERFEDDFEWGGLSFDRLWGEDAVTGMAVPALDGFMFFVALPFPGDAGACAVEAAFEIGANEWSLVRLAWRVRCGV